MIVYLRQATSRKGDDNAKIFLRQSQVLALKANIFMSKSQERIHGLKELVLKRDRVLHW